MTPLKDYLIVLCTLALVTTAAFGQTFNNIVVDGSSGDRSETSIAVRLSKFLAFGCGPSPRKKIAIDALTL